MSGLPANLVQKLNVGTVLLLFHHTINARALGKGGIRRYKDDVNVLFNLEMQVYNNAKWSKDSERKMEYLSVMEF